MQPHKDVRRPTLGHRLEHQQEIVMVPALQAVDFLQSHHHKIPLAQRNSSEILRAVMERNEELRDTRTLRNPRTLLGHIFTSQCDFNFVGPLLRLHDVDRWLECRQQFQRIMGKEPYSVNRGGNDTILELCIGCEGSQESDSVYSFSPTLVDCRNIEVTELKKTNGLEDAILREGRAAVARLRDRSRNYDIGDQLEVTAYCLLLPLRFGFPPFQVSESRRVLDTAIEQNGDFCFPVPKNLEFALDSVNH